MDLDNIWDEDIPTSHNAASQKTISADADTPNLPLALDDDLDNLFGFLDEEGSALVPAPTSAHSDEGGESPTKPDVKKDGDAASKRGKVLPKLDNEKLLGELGFPALIKEAKSLKFDPKGNELQDLNRILYMYQLWGHKMFPKFQFNETVGRVEKLCHSRSMQIALHGYRDAAKTMERRENASENEDEEDENPEGSQRSKLSPPPPGNNITARSEQRDKSLSPESMNAGPDKLPSSTGSLFHELDDDEDMWDDVREFQQQESRDAETGQNRARSNSPDEDFSFD